MAKMANCLSLGLPFASINKHPNLLQNFRSLHYNFSFSKCPTNHTLSSKLNLHRPFPILSAGRCHATASSSPSESGPSSDEGKDRAVLLHGTLRVTIYKAVRLDPDFGFRDRPIGGPQDRDATGIYVTIDLEKTMDNPLASTTPVAVTLHEHNWCRWYQDFHIYCAHKASDVIFSVIDRNDGGTIVKGRAYLPARELLDGEEIVRWIDLLDENRNPIQGDPKIRVKLQFSDATRDRHWGRGIRSSGFSGVPNTFYRQKTGCRVSLYQDAHVPDNFVPKIPMARGKYYEPRRCWEDIFDAISNAKHLIYIAGWPIYTEMALIRDPRRPKPGGDITLGELLKNKAREGVKVLMLVSDDPHDPPDDDTEQRPNIGNYFDGSDVHCVLCQHDLVNAGSSSFVPGMTPPSNSMFAHNLDRGDVPIFSKFPHNQKILVVDCGLPGGESRERRIVSFVGSTDFCAGRYDTPFHSLFRTLGNEHRDDFYQPNFGGATIKRGGPREPWHGVHSRLEGAIAWDVLSNFEQRWRKQGPKGVPLINLRELDDIIIPPSSITGRDDPETWNVQLFRSIDRAAADGFPTTPEDAARAHLVCRGNNIIDRSIQDAYINAIRRAKNFIYIENQHFLGSSFDWQGDEHVEVETVGCLHLVPKELSLKIVSKIKARERFTVYIVLPMWPEGIPESDKVQQILDWQRRTMEMMYKDIVDALREEKIEEDPKKYLTFFCLGNREVKKGREGKPLKLPDPDSDYLRAQEARRFMIYVHSNTMIVDDEYIIVGSANINQRSMDGGRNTETAMGAYQPHHLAKRKPARGQVYGFRMALWYEHLGMLDNAFLRPESEECVRKVNQIAEKFWKLYASETFERDLPGHLLSYPIQIEVSSKGEVKVLPKLEFFPDTKAPILGSKVHSEHESYDETT